jgi:hypothetical protein
MSSTVCSVSSPRRWKRRSTRRCNVRSRRCTSSAARWVASWKVTLRSSSHGRSPRTARGIGRRRRTCPPSVSTTKACSGLLNPARACSVLTRPVSASAPSTSSATMSMRITPLTNSANAAARIPKTRAIAGVTPRRFPWVRSGPLNEAHQRCVWFSGSSLGQRSARLPRNSGTTAMRPRRVGRISEPWVVVSDSLAARTIMVL